MINKRILIISNNALADANANGRTLKNFFDSDDRENLAQFYIQSDIPDHKACSRFFKATDTQVLKAFLKRMPAGCAVEEQAVSSEGSSQAKRRRKKNPLTMLIRTFLWNRKGWRSVFYEWVDEFCPEIILFQAGDCPFLYRISVDLSKKYNAPLVIYNSEDYYFKNYNYFPGSGVYGAFYPFFRRVLKRETKDAIERAALSIYISEDLKNLYDSEFHKNSSFIYTSTDISPCEKENEAPVFSYLGNIMLNRHLGLIEIAEALHNIDPDYKLDVYGRVPDEKVKSEIIKCDSIRYHGVVSYDEVKAVIKNSMLVFHTESFEKFYSKDIKHGFSTKIPDSLACGTCFVLYAPQHITCAKYIGENDCGVLITDKSELVHKLSTAISDKELRSYYINNAIKVAAVNHNAEKNREKFASLINNLC